MNFKCSRLAFFFWFTFPMGHIHFSWDVSTNLNLIFIANSHHHTTLKLFLDSQSSQNLPSSRRTAVKLIRFHPKPSPIVVPPSNSFSTPIHLKTYHRHVALPSNSFDSHSSETTYHNNNHNNPGLVQKKLEHMVYFFLYKSTLRSPGAAKARKDALDAVVLSLEKRVGEMKTTFGDLDWFVVV